MEKTKTLFSAIHRGQKFTKILKTDLSGIFFEFEDHVFCAEAVNEIDVAFGAKKDTLHKIESKNRHLENEMGLLEASVDIT